MDFLDATHAVHSVEHKRGNQIHFTLKKNLMSVSRRNEKERALQLYRDE